MIINCTSNTISHQQHFRSPRALLLSKSIFDQDFTPQQLDVSGYCVFIGHILVIQMSRSYFQIKCWSLVAWYCKRNDKNMLDLKFALWTLSTDHYNHNWLIWQCYYSLSIIKSWTPSTNQTYQEQQLLCSWQGWMRELRVLHVPSSFNMLLKDCHNCFFLIYLKKIILF